MKIFRIIYKIIALKILLVVGMVLMGTLASRENPTIPTQKQKNMRKWWLKKIVAIVGLHLQVKGKIPDDKDSSLWVSNHVSWLDIPVIGSMGVGFLSKSEVRLWPVIGWLGEKSGTVFIERGGQNASQNASREIAEKILSGDNILVFPEATTTNGENVKRFHARIFAPAIDHTLRVQPIAVQYLNQQGQPHPSISWVDKSFISNLLSILGEPGTSINVVLTFLSVLEADGYTQRKQLAEAVENRIRAVVTSTL